MKTVFIIAGFDIHNTAASDKYLLLRNGLGNKGYRVIGVNISWRQTTPTQYVNKFLDFYSHHKSDENVVVGNSFGAVVAFISAPIIKPDLIYLCSLSPFFSEDRGKQPSSDWIKYFGKRRMWDLWSYSADKIAEKINETSVKTYVLYGEKEHTTSPNLVKRCVDTASKIKTAELIELSNAPHSMADDAYLSGIIKLV